MDKTLLKNLIKNKEVEQLVVPYIRKEIGEKELGKELFEIMENRTKGGSIVFPTEEIKKLNNE